MKGGYWPDPKEHMVTERDLVKCTRTKRSQALATFPPNRYAMKFIIRSSVNWLVWSHASKQWNLYNFSSVCILFAKWFNGGIGSPRYYIPLVTFFLQLCNTASLEYCTAGNVGNESSNSVFISFVFAVRRRHSKSSVKLIKSRQTLRRTVSAERSNYACTVKPWILQKNSKSIMSFATVPSRLSL